MDKTKAGALAITALIIITVGVPDHEQKHIEQRPTTPEPALLMDGAIISTLSGSAPTTIQFSLNPPKK